MGLDNRAIVIHFPAEGMDSEDIALLGCYAALIGSYLLFGTDRLSRNVGNYQ